MPIKSRNWWVGTGCHT